jgi:diacylglycerol kinase
MVSNIRARFHHRVLSFKYAFEGITAAVKEEPNLRFHLGFAFLVLLVAFYFQISALDWIIVVIMIGLVLTLELTNTAIEAVVDSFTEEQHPRAKYAKDISAAAVLIAAISAVIVGLIIFLPYIKSLTI